MKRVTSKKPWLKILGLAAVVAIALFTRLWRLSEVPTFLAHDEMIYAINAQSLAKSGTDLTGTWNPWSLTPMHPSFAELPTVFMAPFTLLPVEPTLAAKLPFVLMSLILPVILAGIAYELFRDKSTSICTGIVAIFNPWLWQFGRMGFDSYWSLFFYSLGAYMLLRLPRLQKLWSIVPFFVGFYQYQGHKLVFIPWIGLFVVYLIAPFIGKNTTFQQVKQREWRAIMAPLTVLAVSLLLFIFYAVVQLPHQASSERVGTMLLPNSPEIALQVNEARRLSVTSPATQLFVNRYTIWGKKVAEKFFETYDLGKLFVQGTDTGFYAYSSGYFYLIDGILIVFGVLELWKRQKYRITFLLASGILIAAVPAVLGNGDFSIFRFSLAVPLLLLLTGYGMKQLLGILPKAAKVFLVLCYVASIANFAYEYFVRYPVYAAESNYFSERIVSTYVGNADPSFPIVIYTPEPHFLFTTLLFYNNWLTPQNISAVQASYKNEEFVLRNIRITTGCVPSDLAHLQNVTTLVRQDTRPCSEAEDKEYVQDSLESGAGSSSLATSVIADVQQSGEVYRIYNDRLCDQARLPDYLSITELESFNMPALDSQSFCSSWLIPAKE